MELFKQIHQFSQEESTAFRFYLRAKNKRSDVRNIELYNLIRKKTPLDNIDTVLYGKPNRNAYHALSKRLQDSLIDFIAARNFATETSEDMQVFKWILVARVLYEQNLPKAARKLLLKASKKARELDLYSALIESEHTQIQYSHLHPEIDLNALTRSAQENHKRFLQQEKLNVAYAHIKRALIFDEKLLTTGIQKTVQDILDRYEIQLEDSFTFKSLYQLLEILNTAAHLDHNFSKALPFISSIYGLIVQKKSPKEKQRFYHIQVLYFMANTHFRVRNFEQALHYINLMKEEMQFQKGKWESRFRESLLLIHSFVLNYSGNAITAIINMEQYISSNKKQVLDSDVLLALTVFHTQQELYKNALSTLNLLKHTNTWYQERHGLDWVLKKDLTALIIYYELEYLDLVTSHLRSFKRSYKAIIKTEPRLQRFIATFTKMFIDPNVIQEDSFRQNVKSTFTKDSLKDEDIFMLSFFAWIKAKLNQTPLYLTTLELL